MKAKPAIELSPDACPCCGCGGDCPSNNQRKALQAEVDHWKGIACGTAGEKPTDQCPGCWSAEWDLSDERDRWVCAACGQVHESEAA
jgi:hypothetical protein